MSDSSNTAILTGASPMILANQVSDAINAAMRRGMECDEAVSVALQVVVDYGRTAYGPGYVKTLSEAVKQMGRRPLPEDSSHAR